MSCVKGRKQEIAAWAHRHLRRETVVYSDGLACFRGVEEAGCEHRPRVTGGGPGSCEAPGPPGVKRALDGTYHASEICAGYALVLPTPPQGGSDTRGLHKASCLIPRHDVNHVPGFLCG